MIIYKFLKKPLYQKVEILKRIFWFFHKYSFGSFGKLSLLDRPLVIYNKKNIFIGDSVTIRPNIRIEPIKRWISKEYYPRITIGDFTCIEQNCHITCASKVYIGKYVTIAAYSCVSDIDHEYEDIEKGILQQPIIIKETVIGDGTFIGMGSRIMPGTNIGKHCIIGANSVVNRDIPDYAVAVGIPARIVKKYNFKTNKWEKTNVRGEFINE